MLEEVGNAVTHGIGEMCIRDRKLTEEWKSYRADEPSEFYLKTTKIGGILFALFGIITVSYTHLDVYKRQTYDYVKINGDYRS